MSIVSTDSLTLDVLYDTTPHRVCRSLMKDVQDRQYSEDLLFILCLQDQIPLTNLFFFFFFFFFSFFFVTEFSHFLVQSVQELALKFRIVTTDTIKLISQIPCKSLLQRLNALVKNGCYST